MMLEVSAFARDTASIDLVDGDSQVSLVEQDYVPRGMCIGGGDYIRLLIDIETGTIVDWDADAVKQRIHELRAGQDD